MRSIAKVYLPNRKDGLIYVSYRDPSQREKSGRSKRVIKWFRKNQKGEARAYAREVNERILREGTVGAAYDGGLRKDACAARELLDSNGQGGASLVEVARDFISRSSAGGAARMPIEAAISEYLEHMEFVSSVREKTLTNLRVRLGVWVQVAGLKRLGDIDRKAVLALRDRRQRRGRAAEGEGLVGATTRVNDLRVASAFCSWLVEKELLTVNPVKGVRKPDVERDREPPAVWSAEELKRLLDAARDYAGGLYLPALIAMNFIGGARPSEVEGVRLRYERDDAGIVISGLARIEGGKMGGRANRNVELLPVALAWLGAVGYPTECGALPRFARMQICELAGRLKWSPDICRHTCISNLAELRKNDAAVARECGTSEGVIYSRYHNLRDPEEVEKWAGLRP